MSKDKYYRKYFFTFIQIKKFNSRRKYAGARKSSILFPSSDREQKLRQITKIQFYFFLLSTAMFLSQVIKCCFKLFKAQISVRFDFSNQTYWVFSPHISIHLLLLSFLESSERKRNDRDVYAVHLSIEIDSENEIVAYVIKRSRGRV